uniref:Uncharacterized protein n=1 Tax=Marseillevirus LCMAC103 TaxID=2506604 RepID=A0A481YV88_9VIRU|nr:MAG: hypothetical protein LCMAC103_01500 [Marseillevirus LCMAC103]
MLTRILLVAIVVLVAFLICRGGGEEAFHAARDLELQLAHGTALPYMHSADIDPSRVLIVKFHNADSPPGMLRAAGEGYLPIPGLDTAAGAYRDSGQAPAQFSHGGAWPPSMFSRLRHWEPGFSTTSNWSWAVRPGMEQKHWPRARWVADNGRYFYINNEGHV